LLQINAEFQQQACASIGASLLQSHNTANFSQMEGLMANTEIASEDNILVFISYLLPWTTVSIIPKSAIIIFPLLQSDEMTFKNAIFVP
jgi:hypothetical protein